MKLFQLYKYATWGLLVLNISMIAFFFLTGPPRPSHPNNSKKIPLKMILDEQQDKSFSSLAKQHQQKMVDFNQQQRDLLLPYFIRMIDPSITIDSDSLLKQVQILEQKKIKSTYLHFQDIKSILRPEQHPSFEKFVERAVGRILLGQEKRPNPPKGR